MSRFPQDILLYPDGQPRVLNSDNRLQGEINGVSYRVDLKGDFAICSFIDQDGRQHVMYQPCFNAISIVTACAEIAAGKSLVAGMQYVGLRSIPGGGRLSGY